MGTVLNIIILIWATLTIISSYYHWKLPESEFTWLLSSVVSVFYGPSLLILLILNLITLLLNQTWLITIAISGLAALLLIFVTRDKWKSYQKHKPDSTLLRTLLALIKIPNPFIAPDKKIKIPIRNRCEIPADLFLNPQKKSPLMIFFFGGGFMNNDHTQNRAFLDQVRNLGFHVASIGYRQLPHFPWPEPLLDVEEAIQYLMNTKFQDVEFDGFHVMGRSAGGFMALQASLLKYPFEIKSCTAIYPLSDLKLWSQEPISNKVLKSKWRIDSLFNSQWERVDETSLLDKAFENNTKYLVVSGDADPVVDVQQTLLLEKHLQVLNKKNKVVILETDTHGFDFNPYNWSSQIFIDKIKKL